MFNTPLPLRQAQGERRGSTSLPRAAKHVVKQSRVWGDQETLTIGMGISTGYVTVGNIGPSSRMDYTVVGNHVNLASRLADRAKPEQILIEQRTLAAVQDLVNAREVDQVELEGVSRAIRIYEINERDANRLETPA